MDELAGLNGLGTLQAGVMWQTGTYALNGAFEIHDDESGLHQYVLVL